MCAFRGLKLYVFFTSGDLLDAPKWTQRMAAGQIKHTQHDSGHFDIALALAEYVAEPEEPCALGTLMEREAWEDALAKAENLLREK